MGMESRPLRFSDGPMFNRIMHDKEICRRFLERVLRIDIEDIEYPASEYSIEDVTGERGVRLDVFVKSEGKIFDVEMQLAHEPDLGRRMRYYQSKMDADSLDRAEMYGRLPDSFIIFICRHDQYGKGLPTYTFDMTCKENPGADADAGFRWIVLNSTAWQDESELELSQLLQYINEDLRAAESRDTLVNMIERQVAEANFDIEWRRRAMGFMTLEYDHKCRLYSAEKAGREQGLQEGLEKGLEQGRQEGIEQGLERGLEQGHEEGLQEGMKAGQDRLASLMRILMSEGKTEELDRALNSSDYREELYKEYGL